MMHGIMTGRVCSSGLSLSVSLHDIQQLNVGMSEERFNFCKVSSVAALKNLGVYTLCSAGAALGYGVGPLLLKRPGALSLSSSSVVLGPGVDTTAHALFRFFYPDAPAVQHRVFSEIMPALKRGEADYGVVIHEGRFTYESLGLELEVDLGALWEQRFSLPLPLGCLVAHRRVGDSDRANFEALVRSSIEYGYSHRDEVYGTMKQHAQELEERAIWSHVETYVNEWSMDLGDVGLAAFEQLEAVLL